MQRFNLIGLLVALLAISACAKSVWAPDEAVKAAFFASGEPPSITLVTVINNRDGSGGHSGLIIDASQRVAFDPAGNFQADGMAERNDVVYGMTPPMLNAYYRFHARTAWHVVTQKVYVTPEVAELALKEAQDNGAVPSAFCSNAVTALLRRVPGFESIPNTFYPKKTMQSFAELPNVETDKLYEYD